MVGEWAGLWQVYHIQKLKVREGLDNPCTVNLLWFTWSGSCSPQSISLPVIPTLKLKDIYLTSILSIHTSNLTFYLTFTLKTIWQIF